MFLSVARGKVSEGIDFDRHYGRAVVLFGIPFQYTKSHILLSRLEYLRRTFAIREDEFLAFDALRQASQCVGRVIRNKSDYGLMIFADKRYNNASKRSKLPPWITNFLEESNTNLSTEEAVAVARNFLRTIAQPLPPSSAQSATLLTLQQLQDRARQNQGPQVQREDLQEERKDQEEEEKEDANGVEVDGSQSTQAAKRIRLTVR